MTQPGIVLRKRAYLLLGCFCLIALGIAGRLAYLQFVRGPYLREQAFNVRTHEVPVEARRGVIYDRLGRELAVSVNVDSIFAVPSEVKDAPATARKVAEVLGLDYDWVAERLAQNSAFVWLKRKIPDEVSQALKVLDLPGINFTPESRRVYPKGSVAAHVLGFAGIDSQGLAGVEYSYDDQLRGTPGSIIIEYDAIGRQIPQAMHRYIAPVDGQSLVLTIDEVIQSLVERELDTIMLENKPKHATIVVMDPRNGEILGLGCRPGFDPNRFADSPEANWRNFAVSDTYHPGSTFKPVTAAAAVEEGVVSWSDNFYCSGSVVVDDRRLHCHKSDGHGSLSLTGVVEFSCNVGFVNIGLRLGPTAFYKYWHSFGLDSVSGVDLPGEAVSLILPEKDCHSVDLAVMSFGQTLTVTPLELMRAMAAICNGGHLVTPHVGKEFRGADGQVVPIEWPVGQQVISAETSREVSMAMEAVVATGTGKVAYMPGYRLAGKTGTSQKTIGGVVSSDAFISSFCGFGPADNPEVMILVVVDEPVGEYFGSQVAAPPFGRLMRDIYRYLEIPLVYKASEGPAGQGGRDTPGPAELTVPSVVGRPVGEALAILQSAGLRAEATGDVSGVVARQTPGPDAKVAPGTLVLLEAAPGGPAQGLVIVPDVRGRSMTDAAMLLEKAGLRIVIQGTGLAAAQNPAPGSSVAAGSPVAVAFEPPRD